MNYYKLKALGPGLIFASTAIGTSHLVLSTRAGAHHGMIFFGVIVLTLLFKYPFYEFGPRYAHATGNSILFAYKKQGNWAMILFMLVLLVNMFAVTGAVAAVSGGILSSMLGLSVLSMPLLVGGIIVLTGILLVVGQYKALDQFIKLISVLLLITVVTAFVAVLVKGPVEPAPDFTPAPILEGAGLALLISLMGWMPAGMEASTFNSIWAVEKIRTSGYRPSLKEGMFDFNLGYIFAAVLAVMFLTIGAYTVYGSGQLLEGNSTQFSNKLLAVFTAHTGEWSHYVIALAAFGAIYGTLITAWDAFARSWGQSLLVYQHAELQPAVIKRYYNGFTIIIGAGAFLLFYQFSTSMIRILEGATILSFMTAPVIAWLNLKAIKSAEVDSQYQPPRWMVWVAYGGLALMAGFAGFYGWDRISQL